MGKKQRQFSTEYKARVALEAIKGRKTISQIASEFDVHPSQITSWKRQAMSVLKEGFKKRGGSNGQSESRQTDKLYQQIGKLQVENDFLRHAVYPDTA